MARDNESRFLARTHSQKCNDQGVYAGCINDKCNYKITTGNDHITISGITITIPHGDYTQTEIDTFIEFEKNKLLQSTQIEPAKPNRWEDLTEETGDSMDRVTTRLRVPGGWIYVVENTYDQHQVQITTCAVFVPLAQE